MTQQQPYQVPTDPADPAAAALELLVRLPELIVGDVIAEIWRKLEFTDAETRALVEQMGPAGIQTMATQLSRLLGHIAAQLDAEGVFEGLPWSDAQLIAQTIVRHYSVDDDPGAHLMQHALAAATGRDGLHWANRFAAGKALQRASIIVTLAEPATIIAMRDSGQ